MVQVYADGGLVYDSRLDGYELTALSYTRTLEGVKAGTATLTMPPGHPAYNTFRPFVTVVTVYKDDELLFRGRALSISDDFYNFRTVVCEGEMNFFRDGVHRPYVYQDAPDAILQQVVELHNAQVEAFKQFEVGTITVTDPNNYIRLESEKAESFADVLTKLHERCGGYFVVTQSATSSRRVLNWYAELEYRTRQAVEFGENLLDFVKSGASEDVVTVVVPYGAKNEETGERLTIESVNDGTDFIQDYDAVARYGVMARAVYWDDVTEPANLLARAQKYLHEHRTAITTLELTALDLSRVDASTDSMQVGDLVRVRSKPHGVDEDFLLTERTEDLLHPENSRVTLGKAVQTLTGADVAGDYKNAVEIQESGQKITAGYKNTLSGAMQQMREACTEEVEQSAERLRQEFFESSMTAEEVQTLINASVTPLKADTVSALADVHAEIDANRTEVQEHLEAVQECVQFEEAGARFIQPIAGQELTTQTQAGQYKTFDGFLVQWGGVTITPTAAGEPTTAIVKFPLPFAATPTVLATPVSSVPHSISVSVQRAASLVGDPAEAVAVTLTRDGTTATGISWVAFGRAQDTTVPVGYILRDADGLTLRDADGYTLTVEE